MRPIIKGSDFKGNASASRAAFMPVSSQKVWPGGLVAGAPVACGTSGGWGEGGAACVARAWILKHPRRGLEGQAAKIYPRNPWLPPQHTLSSGTGSSPGPCCLHRAASPTPSAHSSSLRLASSGAQPVQLSGCGTRRSPTVTGLSSLSSEVSIVIVLCEPTYLTHSLKTTISPLVFIPPTPRAP